MADPTLDQLTARGTPLATDLIPTLPALGTTLQNQTLANVRALAVNSVAMFGAIDPTGVADSTLAFLAAMGSGQSFTIPAGTFQISASLLMTAAANHGQMITGAGATANDGTGVAKTILRPTAAVTKLFTIDGTSFAGYVQGAVISNLTIDMVNMADASTSVAISQIQAYDCAYENVRVINFGINKVSWQFSTGAYTSQMSNCQGGAVWFHGSAITNATTTISLVNCDILSIDHTFYQNVTLIGGAVQQPSTPAIPITYLAPGTTPYAYLPNTGGLYVAALATIQNSLNFTSVGCDWEQGGGFPATYNDGTHGTLPLIRVLLVAATATNTTFINPGFAGMYLLDYGVNTRILGQQLGATGGTDINNGPEHHLGPLNVKGQIVGFTDLANFLNTNATITFTITPATGAAAFTTLGLQPTADGDQIFAIRNAAAQPLYDFTTNGGGLALNYGSQIGGYTDAFATQTWNISSATGVAQFQGLLIKPKVDSNSIALIESANGTPLLGFNSNATLSSSSLYLYRGLTLSGFSDGGSTQTWSVNLATGAEIAGSISVGATIAPAGSIFTNGVIRTVGVTVSALPSAVTIGNGGRSFVTDATATMAAGIGTTVVGGGANQVPVYSDGANWKIG